MSYKLKSLLTVALTLCLLYICAKYKKKTIIPKTKMVNMIFDIEIAKALLQSSNNNLDPKENLKSYIVALCDSHKVSVNLFNNSIKHYIYEKPVELYHIYGNVLNKINEMQNKTCERP